eukprot:1142407-Pelagomonas_calceolata.AAC.4
MTKEQQGAVIKSIALVFPNRQKDHPIDNPRTHGSKEKASEQGSKEKARAWIVTHTLPRCALAVEAHFLNILQHKRHPQTLCSASAEAP